MKLSFSQIIILIILGFLFFGDSSYIIKNSNLLLKKFKNFFNDNKNTLKKQKYNDRKKGI